MSQWTNENKTCWSEGEKKLNEIKISQEQINEFEGRKLFKKKLKEVGTKKKSKLMEESIA